MSERKWTLGLAGALFVVVLAAYVETMAGSMSFWDCGEFIATSYILGIPHSPATPLYVVLGRVFTLLPLPLSTAQKVNFMSAFFGALGIAILFLVLVHVLRAMRGAPRTWLDRTVVYGCAAIGALFTAWSNTYWNNAIEAEVYAISAFVMGLTTLLALRWSRQPESERGTRIIYLIIYLLSLCVGFHLGTVLVYPAIVLYLLLFRKRSFRDADLIIFSFGFFLFMFWVTSMPFFKGGVAWFFFLVFFVLAVVRGMGGRRFVSVASLLFVLGISIHLFLLIRSRQEPAIDEGDPQNLSHLMAVLRREQYPLQSPFVRKGSWHFQIVEHFGGYLTQQYELVREGNRVGQRLAFVPILVGLVGMVALARRRFRDFAMFFTILGITSLGMILFLNFSDGSRGVQPEVRARDYFYSPAFYFFGVFIGVGVAALLDWFFARARDGRAGRIDRIGTAAGVAVFLGLTCMLYTRYHFEHDRTRERVPWGYGYNMLAGLEPNALIFTNGDNDTFPLWYQQQVEHFRTDVRVLNLSLLNTTWYPRQVRDNEPKVGLKWTDAEIESLPEQAGEIWRRTKEEFQPRDLAVIKILQDNYGKKPIYFAVTIPPDDLARFEDRLVLEGLVYRFQSAKGKNMVDVAKLAQNVDHVYRFDGILTPDGRRDTRVYRDSNQELLVQNYANAFLRLALQAEREAERATDPAARRAAEEEAARRYQQALEISPDYGPLHVALGSLYVRMGEPERARELYMQALAQSPDDDRVRFELASLDILEGNFDKGIAGLRHVVQRRPDDVFLRTFLVDALWRAGQESAAEAEIAAWESMHPGNTELRAAFQQLQSEGVAAESALGLPALPAVGSDAADRVQARAADSGLAPRPARTP